MLRLSTILCLALALQQTPPNTALIVGRVLDQSDGTPIPNAVVELVNQAVLDGAVVSPSTQTRRQMTDSLGRFVFRELPGGVYAFRATAGGNGFSPSGFIQNGFGFPASKYLDGGYGQRRPGGPLQPLVVAEGQSIPDLVVQLWRGAAINGVVIDDTGEPVVDTVVGAVQVSSDGRLLNGPTVRTDDRGMYRLSALVPGRYIVFVPQTTTAMSAASAEDLMRRVAELKAASSPGAPVAPVAELTGVRVGSSIVKTATSGLIDGNVTPRRDGDAVFVFQTTFHPAAVTLGSAAPIELAAGDDRIGVDVSLQPVRAAAVSGTVFAGGAPASGVRLRLAPMSSSPDASLFETAVSQTDALGRFTFPLVPVGNYSVKAMNSPLPIRPAASQPPPSQAPADAPGAWLTESVGVGPEGVKDLAFVLKPGLTVRGDMEFVGASPRPSELDISRLTVALRSAQPRARVDLGNGGALVAPSASGAFAAVGIPPGRYVFRVPGTPPGFSWRVQSVLVSGREMNDVPFDVTEDLSNVHVVFTDRPASMSGRVTSAEPGDSATAVLLFPADRALWPDARSMARRFRLARTTAEGNFSMLDVPPGDYLVVAVLDTGTADWPDVALLTKVFPESTAVRVGIGQNPAVSLTVKRFQ